MKKNTIIMTTSAILLFLILLGPIMSNVEQPSYEVISSNSEIEIRKYEALIVAETQVQGSRENSIKEGFRTIADYIFGNNQNKQEIAMTAPVLQQQNASGWFVRFVLPAEFNLKSLPKPNKNLIRLREINQKKYAVIKFSGSASKHNISTNQGKLDKYLSKNNITAVSTPTYAFYNPPWTLPFLRRNEILIEIQ